VAEACIVPAFLLILSMFFTYQEQSVLMPIMWMIGNSSPITSGLLSYGVLWIKTGSFAPWKWFMGESTTRNPPHFTGLNGYFSLYSPDRGRDNHIWYCGVPPVS